MLWPGRTFRTYSSTAFRFEIFESRGNARKNLTLAGGANKNIYDRLRLKCAKLFAGHTLSGGRRDNSRAAEHDEKNNDTYARACYYCYHRILHARPERVD